jgi:glutaredoxin
MKAQPSTWLGLAIVIAVAALGSQWWAARSESALAQRIVASAGVGDIEMLSSNTCPICTLARQWFDRHGVRYRECFIETDAVCAQRFEAARSPGTPVILVRGAPLVGFDPRRIEAQLEVTPANPRS